MAPSSNVVHFVLKRAMPLLLLKCLSIVHALPTSSGFITTTDIARPSLYGCRGQTELAARSGDGQDEDLAEEALKKTAWYATEAFGKVFGRRSDNNAASTDVPPSSSEETLRRIRSDVIDRSYFLSGEVDRLIYSEDCVFADPFVSFSGRDRFIDNLANLGSFITNYDARLISFDTDVVDGDESDPLTVSSKIMVKLELNLPWKPVLAWPWGVAYTIDPASYLVTDHIESWDIDAIEGVKQIFRKPTVTIKDKD